MKHETPFARWEIAGVGASMLIATGLSFFCLGCRSFWIDEGFSAQVISMSWGQVIDLILYREPSMPLYFLLLRAWSMLGTEDTFLRALSIIPVVATVPCVHLIGRKLWGPRVGVLASALFSINAFAIEYAHEARGYSLVMFLVTLSTLLFILALEVPSSRRWVAYTGVSTLALLTHVFALAVIVVHGLSLFIRERGSVRVRTVLCVFGVLGLGVMPLVSIPLLNFLGRGAVEWVDTPTIVVFVKDQASLAGQARILSPYVLGVALSIAIAVQTFIRKGRTTESWREALVPIWYVLPIVGTFVISLTLSPVWVERYLIVVVPALPLMCAAGTLRFQPRWLIPLALVAIVALGGAGLIDEYWAPRTDWRAAAEYVEANASPGDRMIIFKNWGTPVYQYYASQNAGVEPEIVSPAEPGSSDTPPELSNDSVTTDQVRALIDDPANNRDRVWLVLNHLDHEDESNFALTSGFPSDFELLKIRDFAGFEVRLLQETE